MKKISPIGFAALLLSIALSTPIASSASLITSSIAISAADTSATVSYATNAPSKTWLLYTTTPQAPVWSEYKTETLVTTHTAILSNLIPQQTYYFHIRTDDGTTQSLDQKATSYSTFYTGSLTTIAALQARLVQLQQQLAFLQQQAGGASLITIPAQAGSQNFVFARNLKQGDTGADVKNLQVFLNTHGFTVSSAGVGSPGNETDYFGPATKRALAAFQEKHKEEVLLPAGLSQGSGFFGALTRKKLSALLSASGQKLNTNAQLPTRATTGVVSAVTPVPISPTPAVGGGSGPSVPSPSPNPTAAIDPSEDPNAPPVSPVQPPVSPPSTPIEPGVTTNLSSITQFGITWTFDKAYPVGQFVNGDYYVVGPVKIIGISPNSVDLGGRVMNGSMLNPVGGLITQGYDNAMYATHGGAQPYSAALNVALNVSDQNPLSISQPASLVSTISKAQAGARPQLQTAAVLTVLSSVPPLNSFRPSYSGTDKTIRFNKSQLNIAQLPSLAPVPSTPSIATIEAQFEKPWIDHVSDWVGRYSHPSDNLPDYGREITTALSNGLLALTLNIPKETLAIRLAQIGIDLTGVADNGGYWKANGGHDQGRMIPIVVAGYLLNDSHMKGAGNWTTVNVQGNKTNHIFQEQCQHFYVTQYDVGRLLTPDSRSAMALYTQADVGKAEWGIRHCYAEEEDNAEWLTAYRIINGQSLIGHTTAAKIMGLKSIVNAPAFFDYQERWAGIDLSKASTVFAREMYATYYNAAPPSPPPTGGSEPTPTPTPEPTPTPTPTPTPPPAGGPTPSDGPTVPSGLVGYWPLNGDATDLSGNGNDGTLVNGSAFVTGKIGQAVSFDGINDYINIGANAALTFGTGDYTLSAWVYPTATSTSDTIIEKGSNSTGNTHEYRLQYSGSADRVTFSISDGTSSATTSGLTGSAPPDQWVHFACTVSSNIMQCYTSGVANGAPATRTITPYVSTTSGYIGITKNSAPARPFHGSIDDVRIYNRALDASEVQTLYASGLQGLASAPSPLPPTNYQPQTNQAYLANTLDQIVSVMSMLLKLLNSR